MRNQPSSRVHAMLWRAALAAALCCLFTVVGATSAAAQVTVNILNPADLPEDDPIAIAVSVTSASAVTSVEAKVGTKTVALDLHNGNWFGYIDMSGLARGQHQLVVTATNAAAQTGQATRTFMLDRRPTINLTSPADYALGLPDIRATATCTDDGGPCLLTVGYVNGPYLAAGQGSLDTLIKPFDGTAQIEFTATDSTNRTGTKVRRTVVVLSSTRLRSEQGFTGRILDVQTARALVYDDLASPRVVRIVNRTTNASETIWTAPTPNHHVVRGSLMTAGAILEVSPAGGPLNEIQEWRGGTLTLLGLVEQRSFRVNGQWAIYTVSDNGQFPLTLRDLTSGTNTIVDANAGKDRNDVTADGRAFYWDGSPSEIFRYEPGTPPVTTQLTSGAPAQSRNPLTDGVNVVFARQADQQTLIPSTVLRLGDGTEIVLATQAFQPFNETPYQIANGWVAFLRNDGNGPTQAWLRAPDGTQRQLSPAGGSAVLQGLNETGEVVFDVSTAAPFQRRYLARTDGSIIDLGIAVGEPFFFDNAWHIAAGSQLLAVDPAIPSRSILSEGATGTFFTTDVAILNPHDTAVPVTIRYLRENASELVETRTLPAMSRTTIHEDDIPGLEGASVSTVVEAPAPSPVVVERLMSWDATGYGGHLGTAVDRPRARWFFAEGAQGFFYTFFLLANSSASEATVKFTFLIEQGTPMTQTVTVAPGTRKTLYAGDVTDLINRSFATVIESDVPIVAERAMYFGDSPLWLGGHGTAGVAEPSYRWYHAEGATGSLFDTFILLANPNQVDVTVQLTFTTDKGQNIVRTKVIPASSRLTVNIEDEAPELANTAVSTLIETVAYPVVSERAMYWGTTGNGWREGHNSFGVTEAGPKWGLAEGRSGGPRGYQTYVLVSNTSGGAADLRVTFVKEGGTSVVRNYRIEGSQRLNIPTSDIPELANSNFSTIVESLGAAISVEGAIYWNANGVIWEGGGNTVGTRLP